MSAPTTSAPYSRAVVSAMRRLYPEALADKSFDNTGLLLEAPFDPLRRQMNSVLLTVDLTKAVADEAVERNDSIVIAYHPIIFKGLKSLTLKDTQQQSLLRLAAEGISVYSPHTAVDCQKGGLGDWLADIVTGTPAKPAQDAVYNPSNEQLEKVDEEAFTDEATNNETQTREGKEEEGEDDSADAPAPPATNSSPPKRPTYMLQHHPSQLSLQERALNLGQNQHKRYPIQASTDPAHPDTGMGRIVRLSTPIPLTDIMDRIGLGLGNPRGFPIAIPQGKQASDMMIGSVGICAGSGGGLFSSMEKAGEEVDLYFTGELSHHEALAAIEKGKCVICLFHSNTERGFLHSVLKPQLEEVIAEEWERIRNEERSENLSEEFKEALDDEHVEVQVSEIDRDPYGIMINKGEL